MSFVVDGTCSTTDNTDNTDQKMRDSKCGRVRSSAERSEMYQPSGTSRAAKCSPVLFGFIRGIGGIRGQTWSSPAYSGLYSSFSAWWLLPVLAAAECSRRAWCSPMFLRPIAYNRITRLLHGVSVDAEHGKRPAFARFPSAIGTRATLKLGEVPRADFVVISGCQEEASTVR
jgi:hypothetical protein